jgi:hypothetical protein
MQQTVFSLSLATRLVFLLVLITSIYMSAAISAEVYKIIDDNGDITYTDKPPHNSSEKQVETVGNSGPNIMPSPETVAENDPEWVREQHMLREKQASKDRLEQQQKTNDLIKQWQQNYASAKVSLKKTKQALAEGKEIGDGDYVGNAGGGARPSNNYLERVAGLKADLLKAEKELKRLKHNKPKR